MAGLSPAFCWSAGLVVKSLRALDLGLGGFDASGGRNGLQIGIADGQHDHLARVFVTELRGFQTLRSSAFLLEILEIEERLAERSTRVKIVESRDDARKAG